MCIYKVKVYNIDKLASSHRHDRIKVNIELDQSEQ